MRFAIIALMFLAPASASAQTAQPSMTDPAPALPHESSEDDIVVQALRIPRDRLPLQVHWDYFGMVSARVGHQRVRQYVNCAVLLSPIKTLRSAVDGEINSPNANFAQGSIVSRNSGCFGDIVGINGTTVGPLSETDFGRSPIHRGAIADAVLRKFAPDAVLTREDTTNPRVRSRFLSREGYRNRLRFPDDLNALRVMSCLVEDQPGFATRLMRAEPGSRLEMGLIQAMFVEGRSCLGGIKRMTIEPLGVRGYVADAFYRWVVASRDVKTLIDRRS